MISTKFIKNLIDIIYIQIDVTNRFEDFVSFEKPREKGKKLGY